MISAIDLDHLLVQINTRPPAHEWRGWLIQPITGGMNNLIYRATNGDHDLAIKLMRRDARDRAGREYAALTGLSALGLDLAPRAILVERERYVNPLVVQSWLDGIVSDTPPGTDAEWQALLHYYATLHTVTPDRWHGQLEPAFTNLSSVAQGRAMVQAQLGMLPEPVRPPELIALVQQLEQTHIAEPDGGRLALCRVDANTRNFIRPKAPGGHWRSVDWENSGWGEPAFELVDLMTHPTYRAVTPARWAWAIAQYLELSGDTYAPAKIAALYPVMLVWWVARTARLIHELPRGMDARLNTPVWDVDLAEQLQRYAAQARAALSAYQ